MKSFALTIAAVAATAGAASAQTPACTDPGNMTRFGRAIKARYDTIKGDIVEAAEGRRPHVHRPRIGGLIPNP